MEIQTGTVLGRYRVGALLGESGPSITWRAVHLEDGSDRAIKLVQQRNPAFLERLRRAAEAQQRVAHTNLVRVDEVLEVNGLPALVMEYVDGGTLEDWLAAERRPLGQLLAVFRGIVQGVGAAHDAELVHRNLKPAKILLARRGEHVVPKVNDFTLVKVEGGGAKLTQLGMSFGTPQYMAPEQFRDVSGVDRRADLFALGAILYEMVVGERAFHGNNVVDIYQQVAARSYAKPAEKVPDLPPVVADVIDRLLSPDKEERPASSDELLALLYGTGELDAALGPWDTVPAAFDEDDPVDDLDDDEPLPTRRSWVLPVIAAIVVVLALLSLPCCMGAWLYLPTG